MKNPALTAAERVKLTLSGAIIPPPLKRGRPVPIATDLASDAHRAWLKALQNARTAYEELGRAEREYVTACEAAKARGSRRRMPAIDPYAVPRVAAA